jgi:predicted nuclease with TOPRIM domain
MISSQDFDAHEEFLIETYRKERTELIDRAWRKTHEATTLQKRLEALQKEYNELYNKHEHLKIAVHRMWEEFCGP